MATYTGTFRVNGKIWDKIGEGATVLATPPIGTAIKGDAITAGADGVKYMHLTSPKIGYTKVEMLDYTLVDPGTPPTPPAPPPVTSTGGSMSYDVTTGITTAVFTYSDGTSKPVSSDKI